MSVNILQYLQEPVSGVLKMQLGLGDSICHFGIAVLIYNVIQSSQVYGKLIEKLFIN